MRRISTKEWFFYRNPYFNINYKEKKVKSGWSHLDANWVRKKNWRGGFSLSGSG